MQPSSPFPILPTPTAEAPAMTNEITSTAEMDEREWDGQSEPDQVRTDAVATREPEGRGIEFTVSMRDYTQRDMEALIVEAAAALIVGHHRDRQLAQAIEAKCIEQITVMADKTLAAVTAEIIDQPLTPSFGDKKPVTMREFIGLTGREYLDARVGNDGKPVVSDGWSRTNSSSRIEYLVSQYMQRAFKQEIEKATNAVISELQQAIRAEHAALLEAEKARFRAALGKAAS